MTTLLAALFSDWHKPLVIVKPATVIEWHRRGFRALWRRRSRPGRPPIPRAHIELIRRISADHPEWGEDKIAAELAIKLGIAHSPSTIRRYRVPRGTRPPRGDQTWRTFVRNHAREVWACDFVTQYTALFAVVYVFVVMEISSRRIVHIGVTTSPTLPWVKQQILEAAPPGEAPRFLIHDNDGIYGQLRHAKADAARPTHRCTFDRWLEETMGIEGKPIRYGAPNATPHVERFMRTLREDALDHFIFLNEGHVARVVKRFVEYCNGARPSQATNAIPDPYPELREPPLGSGRLVAHPVLGGIQHDYRLAA